MVDEKLLPYILTVYAQSTPSLHATQNVWCFKSACSSRYIAPTYGSPPHSARHAHHHHKGVFTLHLALMQVTEIAVAP